MALSGGMDSAATVLWLREAGYRPRALFLDLLDSDTQRRQVQAAAEALGVALHIEPCAELFRHEIIGHTLAEHAAGRTPSPCARCNGRIKWRLLADTADRLGIFHIATGHYVRTIHHEGHSYFRRGADPAKDQSYYLWEVPEATIRRALLPLGDYTKEEVRRILRERYRLTELSARRESMGLCFLNGMRYGAFLQAHLPPARYIRAMWSIPTAESSAATTATRSTRRVSGGVSRSFPPPRRRTPPATWRYGQRTRLKIKWSWPRANR